MSEENKDKKDVKDLAPKKDAQGGSARYAQGGNQAAGGNIAAGGNQSAGGNLPSSNSPGHPGQQASGVQED